MVIQGCLAMQDWNEVKAVNAGIDRIISEAELPEIRMSIAHSLKTAGKRLRPSACCSWRR